MRKIYLFMLTLLSAMGGVLTANAGFRIPYKSSNYWTAFSGTVPDALQTVINKHNDASHTATPPSTTSTTGTLHFHSCPVAVTANGDITVTLTYTNGGKMLYIMGVELVQGSTVVKSDYHVGSSGSNHDRNAYTLSDVTAGNYEARFYVCNDSGNDHPLSGSNGIVTFDGAISLRKSTTPSLTTTKFVRINNVGRSGNKLTSNSGTLQSKSGVSDDDPNAYWALESTSDGKYYLKNCMTGTYVKNVTEDKIAWTLSGDDAKVSCTIETYLEAYAGDPAKYAFCFGSDAKDYMHDPGHTDNKVVRWLINETPTQWTISETEYDVNTTFVQVTYNYILNNVQKATETKYAAVGGAYPEVSNSLPYGITATKPAGTVSVAETKDIELGVDLPFEAYTDYNSIRQWYYVNIRDTDPTYLKYESGVNYIKARDAKSVIDGLRTEDELDAYSWGFIGNPYEMKIVNKKSGATMVLSSPAAPTGDQNDGQIARMVTEVGATGNTTWTLQKPTHANAAAGAFYIQHPTATSYAFNRQNKNGVNTVCYWNNRDTGSAIQVVARPSLQEEMNALIAQATAKEAAARPRVGTTVGKVTESSVDALATAITNAEAIATPTRADINALKDACDAPISIVLPDPSKYYEIVNPLRGGKKVYIDNDGKMYFDDLTNKLSTVFKFEDAGDDNFYLKGVERGTYMNSNKGHNGGQETATGLTGSIKVRVASLNADDKVSLTPQGGAMMHADANYGTVVGWNNADPMGASAWRIVEVGEITERTYTVAVTEAEWATMMLGCSVTIPDGVVAYAVTEAGTTAKLKKVTGSIPANYGILINANEGDYYFKFAQSVSVSGSSLLSGTVFTKNITPDNGKTCYVLAVNEGNVGFYKASLNQNNNASFVNNANKAYLSLTTGSNPARFLTFDFDDNAETGINAVEIEEAAPANAAIYDLSGRRVQNAKSGLYIINGKKVIK